MLSLYACDVEGDRPRVTRFDLPRLQHFQAYSFKEERRNFCETMGIPTFDLSSVA
jgi:hypothetical protein